MEKIFALTKEDLSNIGNMMGSASSSTKWIKYFTNVEFAMEYAQKDFSENRSLAEGHIKWHKNKRDKYNSEDLGFCMYYIEPINVIK